MFRVAGVDNAEPLEIVQWGQADDDLRIATITTGRIVMEHPR